jgi:7-keto-8-aminopelargonate synthetase-like enzyme
VIVDLKLIEDRMKYKSSLFIAALYVEKQNLASVNFASKNFLRIAEAEEVFAAIHARIQQEGESVIQKQHLAIKANDG